jgi:hypothetical protein
MSSFQIGLLFSLPVHTYLLTCETGYWSIFIYMYMTGCVKCHVYFSTFVFANESWFVLCRVLSFIFFWFGMVRRKLTIPERWKALGMHNGGFSHRRVADHFRVNHSIIVRLMQRFRERCQHGIDRVVTWFTSACDITWSCQSDSGSKQDGFLWLLRIPEPIQCYHLPEYCLFKKSWCKIIFILRNIWDC